MSFYLGFDGGGTKTECVLLDAQGNTAAQAVTGPSNPLRIGFDAALAALREAADTVLAAAHVDGRSVKAIGAGLAGAGRKRVVKRIMGFLVETFPHSDVHVTTDLEVALEAATRGGEGVVLVAGTGSAAYGRNAAGQTARAGGHGPWIGDEGSAYDIGRQAVAAVARARDGLAPVTLLAELIPAALECPNWAALIDRVAEDPDGVFPRVFPLVVEAVEAEDGPASEILFTAAMALSRLASAVIRRLGLAGAEFTLSKSGGVFGHSAVFDSALDALLHSGAPQVRVQTLTTPPAVGAARLAMRLSAPSPRRAVTGVRR